MADQIRFDFEKRKWEGITRKQVEFWESCYPDVDVVEHITRRMVAWLDSNHERAPKSRWKRFITSWLSRQQDKHDIFKKER